MVRIQRVLRVAVFLVCSGVANVVSADPGAFSVQGLEGWEPQTFSRHDNTVYHLISDGDKTQVLQAQCEHSASGLISKGKIDLSKTPKLSWRWRVHQVYAGLHEQEKSGDDFPARIYVVRDGGWALWRTRALVYVWSNGETDADHWPSPHTSQVQVIPLHKGPRSLGRWEDEQRDIRADFKTYLGMDIDRIDAVALMTDCDDGKGSAQSEYGDITLEP